MPYEKLSLSYTLVLHSIANNFIKRILRVLGASTKIIDKWDEMAYLRDVTIASKDQEVEESRKLLKETKQRQAQLGRCFHDYFTVKQSGYSLFMLYPRIHSSSYVK